MSDMSGDGNPGRGDALDALVEAARQLPESSRREIDGIMDAVTGSSETAAVAGAPPSRARILAFGGLVAAALVGLTLWPPLSSASAEGVHFEIVVPSAGQVTLVGDFNDWSRDSTPLRREEADRWTTRIKLPAGHYNYAFLVDGARWLPDDTRALGPASEFGPPNSVVVVPPSADEGP